MADSVCHVPPIFNDIRNCFLYPVTIVRGWIKICPYRSVHLSVRPFITLYSIEICNQLLPQFSMDLFETLHTYCEHKEDEYMGF